MITTMRTEKKDDDDPPSPATMTTVSTTTNTTVKKNNDAVDVKIIMQRKKTGHVCMMELCAQDTAREYCSLNWAKFSSVQ